MVAGLTRLTLAVLLIVASASCRGDSAASGSIEVVGPAPQHLVAHLEDDSRPLADGRVAWRTWWVLCWDAHPGTRSYELQTVTGEGGSARLRSQSDVCVRVEAAAGEDQPDAVAGRRTTLLATQEGQLAYRVRAVLDGGRRTEWSAPQAVGRVT